MSCDDALKVFGSYMSQYEKDEIKLFEFQQEEANWSNYITFN
jgi:hypothetical protein